MKRNKPVLLAAGGSLALLLAAFAFQYLGDMAPCSLCLWQRWPHGAALLAGALALLSHGRLWPWLGALAASSTGIVGLYHTGVERTWWNGPATCTSGDISELSTEALMDHIMAAPLVRCDEVPWEFLSLSMASWNAAASFALAAIWIVAARVRT